MEVLAITQARIGSSRLPSKVLKTIGNKTLLQVHLERILKSKKIDKLIVASTSELGVEAILQIAGRLNVDVYQGSLENVLDRFYQAAIKYQPKWVVRLTSDCPLMDPHIIDSVVEKAIQENVDYCSNTLVTSFPDGMDVEVFKYTALELAWQKAKLNSEKEHVTPFIYNNCNLRNANLFVASQVLSEKNYSAVRLTVDEQNDLEVIKQLVDELGLNAGWQTYADYYLTHKEIYTINSAIERNEGYQKSLSKDKP